MNNHCYTSWVEVDLDAIRHNFRNLKATSQPAKTMAVVKSEAYGHGLEAVALTAVEEGAWGLAIVSVSEGRRLRQVGIKVPLVLIAPILRAHISQAIEDDLRCVVYDYDFACCISKQAQACGKTAKIHLKVDTGMGRLSVQAEKITDFALAVSKLPNLEIEGIYSHLASADSIDQAYSARQFRRFQQCLLDLEKVGLKIPIRHLAASAGLLLLTGPRLDLTRAGIALYGQWPSREVRIMYASREGDLQKLADAQVTGTVEGDAAGAEIMDSNIAADFIRPALSFKTLVSQVKSVQAGTSVSYGCTFKCHRETTVAVLPVGYADAYDRHLSNNGEVLIRGLRAPVMGRICMNICMVDVTDIPGVREGDEVVLIGHQGQDYISADEIADKIGTINYEVITRIPMHIPRIYLGQKPQGFAEWQETVNNTLRN